MFIRIEGNMVVRPENQNVARGCPNTETVDDLLYYIIDLYPEWYNHTHVSFKKDIGSLSFKSGQLPVNLNPGLPIWYFLTPEHDHHGWFQCWLFIRLGGGAVHQGLLHQPSVSVAHRHGRRHHHVHHRLRLRQVLAVCLSVCRSVFLPVYRSVCLSVCLSFYPSVTLSDSHTVISGQRCISKWNFPVLTEV